MGIFGKFNLPPDSKPEKVSLINRQALEKEEKRKREEEARITKMVKGGMTREQAEEKIAEEEAAVLREMIEKYPPSNGDQSRAA